MQEQIDTRRDVLIVPYVYSWCGGPDPDQVPAHARVIRGGEAIDSFPKEIRKRQTGTKPGTFLYGGPLKIHFGHVMVDSIIRLWAYKRDRHKQVIFAKLQESKDISKWIYSILELFELESDRVLLLKNRCIFEEVDFARPGSRLAEGPSSSYLKFLEKIPLKRMSGTPENVYFGRHHLLTKGTVMGEGYFSRLLQESGFSYIEPETLDIHTQTSILRNASRVVFMEGSSIYSIELLSKISASVFMIPRRPTTLDLFAPHISTRGVFKVLGDASSLVRQETPKGGFKPNSPSYLMRPDLLHFDMLNAGLIKGRFEMSDFLIAEKNDTEAYFHALPQVADGQLEKTYAMRRSIWLNLS